MHDDDWTDLGRQWRAIDSGPAQDPVAKVRATLRKRRSGLFLELAGAGVALGMILYALLRGSGDPDRMAWLAGLVVILTVWQLLCLALRRAHGLFSRPDAGLAGWIEAERQRARYTIAYHWLGLGGGALLAGWAQHAVALFDDPFAARVLAIVASGFLGWTIARTWTLRRLLARLAVERSALEG